MTSFCSSQFLPEKTLSGQRLTESWLEATYEQFAWEATATIVQNVSRTPMAETQVRLGCWYATCSQLCLPILSSVELCWAPNTESAGHWFKLVQGVKYCCTNLCPNFHTSAVGMRGGCALATGRTGRRELVRSCHGKSHSDCCRCSKSSPTVQKRHADSISSFVVIQRQKQNANRLPIQNVKVYFPCLLITKVLGNLPRLALEGAVTVDQSVGDAIQQELVSVGSTFHDTTQKFSTLVLRAGRTSLPSLRVRDCTTPLTQRAFAAGLFDATMAQAYAHAMGCHAA